MRKTALRFLTKFALAGLLVLPFAGIAKAHERFEGGERRVVIVPSYSYYRPYWGWGWGWGWSPYRDYPTYSYPTRGTVKIHDHNKYDQVYINGAYAGIVDKMKNIKLDPGHYTVEIRQQGKVIRSQSVYVVAGKSVDIEVEGG